MKRSAWRYLWTARDIRRKLLITLGIMVIYRFAAQVPVPGVNRAALSAILSGVVQLEPWWVFLTCFQVVR
ncbi:MAG: hypothetical protein H8D34_12460 [Chloroflexi bacterium]|nr:hypothetical protein [Chloroflexota bacterium]